MLGIGRPLSDMMQALAQLPEIDKPTNVSTFGDYKAVDSGRRL